MVFKRSAPPDFGRCYVPENVMMMIKMEVSNYWQSSENVIL